MRSTDGPGLGQLIGLGITGAGFVAIGVGVGYWIGQVSGADVLSTFVGLGLGVAGAILATYLRIRKYL